jgi:excisionase family DNA binding protein
MADDGLEKLMTPAEVAAIFRVDPKTVTRWANSGKLQSMRTLGGHHRFRREAVMALLNGTAGEPAVLPAARRIRREN